MISSPITVMSLDNLPSFVGISYDIPNAVGQLNAMIRRNDPDDLSVIKSMISSGIYPTIATRGIISELLEFALPPTKEMPPPPSYGHNVKAFERVLKSILDADITDADQIAAIDDVLQAIIDDDVTIASVDILHPVIIYRLFRLAAMYLAYEVMDDLHNAIVYKNLCPHPDDKEALHTILERMRHIYDSV